MPFVIEQDDCRRPIKKRKIAHEVAMARYRRDSGSSPEPEASAAEQGYRSTHPRKDSSEETEIRTSDREELIQCIKRGQRPTWVPKPNLEALCAEAEAQAEAKLTKEGKTSPKTKHTHTPHTLQIGLEDTAHSLEKSPADQRPPSALHTGDFGATGGTNSTIGHAREIPKHSQRFASPSQIPHLGSPPPWTAASPFGRFQRTISDPTTLDRFPTEPQNRSRAPSIGSSLSSSYVMRAPTSPLVHATSHLNLDVESNQRRTNSGSSVSINDQSYSPPFNTNFTPPGLRRETTIPMRNHQARRSLTSFTYQPALSASSIYPSRQRRLSHASEVSSPLQRNSMVGSFEESILRGRMSAPPSNPLQFVAKIGVSGKGACPPKLKCPSHVTVPFPAVFYNYPSSAGSRSISDDSPSPYVGTINLREHLEPPEGRRSSKRHSTASELGTEMTASPSPSRRTSAMSSTAAKSSIGGAYRVPQQGQLQIILKNPENTAVKLFLVPYDLEGMLPETKTFVRQRSFSTGPMMENVLSDTPIHDPLSTKHVLRYLIHLKFCCIGKGKFYLYDTIRVVFANRVPDGKEQLKNEIQLPEPRFSVLSMSTSQPTSRHQSGVECFMPSPSAEIGSPQMDILDGLPASSPSPLSANPTPFRLTYDLSPTSMRKENMKLPEMRQTSNGTSSNSSRPTSPEVHGFDRSSVSQRGSPVPWGSAIDLQPRSPSPAFVNGDGLLSKKLRELGRQTVRTSLDDGKDDKQ